MTSVRDRLIRMAENELESDLLADEILHYFDVAPKPARTGTIRVTDDGHTAYVKVGEDEWIGVYTSELVGDSFSVTDVSRPMPDRMAQRDDTTLVFEPPAAGR